MNSVEENFPQISLSFVAPGNLLWEKNFGGTDYDSGRSVVETAGGALVVVGRTSYYENGYQVYMIWTDSKGNGISEPGW